MLVYMDTLIVSCTVKVSLYKRKVPLEFSRGFIVFNEN